MSSENEQFANTWDDEDETELTLRDPYPKATRPHSPQPRSGDSPQNTPTRRLRPRGVPGSAHFYEEIEGDERSSARPRPARQSREEVEARLRQRARQSLSPREQDEPRSTSQLTRRPAPRPAPDQERYDNDPTQSPPYQTRPTRDFSSDTPSRRPTRDFSSDTPSRRPTRDFSSDTPSRRPTRDFSSDTPSRRPTRDFSSDTPSRRPVARATGPDDEYEGYDEIEIIEEPLPRRKRRRSRGGRIFTTLLTGCLGGVLTLVLVAGVLIFLAIHNTPLGQNLGGTNTPNFNQSGQQALDLASATQLIVKNQTGNITINVDPNASTASLTSVKHVQATSQSDADNQFKQIVLSVKSITQGTVVTQGTSSTCLASTCLLINVTTLASTTTPTTNGGNIFGGGNNNSVDLTITLPHSFNSPNPNTITASTNTGNISVNSFQGVLNLNGNVGNITIASALIFAGTCLQTQHGNITVAQGSLFDLASPSSLVPCSNTSSSTQHPWFNIQNGVGNVNITLSGPNLTSLLLDALTNNGSITDDFNLNITSSDGSDSYRGPLLPNTNPTASLYIIASTGNITLHK